MDQAIEALAEVADPGSRAKQASGLLDEYQAVVGELSRVRREAVEEMISSGMTHSQIAHALGVSRGRVSQLTKAGPPPERAFWGTNTLTVALGGKLEASKDAGAPGPVVAQEDFQAYLAISEAVKAMGLNTEYEIIQPPGFVSLNRENLIVICGPRLSPLISQIIESDPVIVFSRDGKGWYLEDGHTGNTYRSPSDDGENSDVAYLARLPRPDARGTFLYIAGIHAIGSSGVVHYLNAHLAEVYREVRTKRFSALVRCTYDPITRVISDSELVTSLYVHGA